MGCMALFKWSNAPVDLTGLEEALGGKAKVLASGSGERVTLVGTKEHLAVRRGDEWRTWRWEEIGSGSWNGEAKTFRWRTIDGDKFEAALTEPARLPELFQERVQASTVVTTVVDARRGQVQIVGRRGLGSDPTIHWYAVPSGGADLGDPETRDLVVAETDRLNGEYL